MSKEIRVLKELGLLTQSPESVPSQRGRPFGAEHVFSGHKPLWRFCNPKLESPFTPEMRQLPVYRTLPPDSTLESAVRETRFLVFLGVGDSPELEKALAMPGTIKLVFEPDEAHLAEWLAKRDTREFMNKGVFFFSGNMDALPQPLLWILPSALANSGFPVFFVQNGFEEALPGQADRLIHLMELFYYRNRIYPAQGQEFMRGWPHRPLAMHAIYDRVLHFYRNVVMQTRAGTLNDLREATPGATAMLVAAGPELDQRLDWVAENADRAVTIVVNNALKPFLSTGLEPDFVIINDTSLDSGRAFAGLKPLRRTRLVAHALSSTGDDVFPEIYFFGTDGTDFLPPRDSLLLHGSVITTAFSLAEYLGCTRAVLVGAQLSSPDPYRLSYSARSQYGNASSQPRELIDKFPQLYPARAADGETVFTSLNFYDSAVWFRDRIRMSNVEVINTSQASLIHGSGVVMDSAPRLESDPSLREQLSRVSPHVPEHSRERIASHLRREHRKWRGVQDMSVKMLAILEAGGEKGLEPARELIRIYDGDNTSFMLQRFGEFRNLVFHKRFFEGATATDQVAGALYYFGFLKQMCGALMKELEAGLSRLG